MTLAKRLAQEINNYETALDRAVELKDQITRELKQADFNTSCDLAEQLQDIKTVIRLLSNKIEETYATIALLSD